MHPGSSDYATSYYNHPPHLPPHHQNPNPTDFISNTPNPNHHPSFASAPPFSQSHQTPPEFSSYSPYLPNPEIAPTAPSFSHQPPPFISAGSDPPFYAYDHPPPPTNYTPPPAASPSLIPNSNVNTPFYPNSYPHLNPPVAPVYEPVYESVKYDHLGTYPNDNSSRYGQATHGPTRSSFDRNDDGLEEGVYAYDGGRLEPYGARGTGGGSKASNWAAFDDYGRSTANSYSAKNEHVGSGKMVRAVPKSEAQMDVMNGVQKFRVKLLPESSGQNTMDVLCQIGLDGIRMLEPNTNKTLRIYPLETLTRWEVTEPSIYAFWSKTSVDIEPRRIRLQSNSYTTSTILDTVTAATVQFKEMGGKDSLRGKGSFDAGKLSDPPMEKKKGFTDWVNLIKPGNEEKDHWVPDEAVTKCTSCGTDFGAFVRKHHCRNCGEIFCDKCTQGRIALTAEESAQPVRVCDQCMAEVSHRLSNAKETVGKSTGLTSHDDLARKLQEEMDRNRKTSSGSKPDGSGKRMREVACPTCTVHLQVQVPSSGSETIECGVCQHPFLVSAH